MSEAMKKTRRLKAKDLVDDIELEPNKSHMDLDVLVAVAEVLRARFDIEKLQEFDSKATKDNDDSFYYLQTPNGERKMSYSSSTKVTRTKSKVEEFNFTDKKQPRGSASIKDDDPLPVINACKHIDNIAIPDKARGSGGKFVLKKSQDQDYNNVLLISKKRQQCALDISKLDKKKNMTTMDHKVNSEYPEGMSREQVLMRERLLKNPIIFNDDQEEKEQKHVMQRKMRRVCSSSRGRRIDEDYDFGEEEKEEEGCVRKRRMPIKANNIKRQGGTSIVPPNPPPDLPTEFRNRILEMGGTNVKLVIQKALWKTDTTKGHNRLSIPILQAANFLEASEKEFLQGRDCELLGKNSIEIVLLQPNLEEIEIKLRQWDMIKKKGKDQNVIVKVCTMYVLNKTWNEVVRSNGLEKGNIIQVWSFRVVGKLRLAIVKLPQGQEQLVEQQQGHLL